MGVASSIHATQVDETWKGDSGDWTTGTWDPGMGGSYPDNGVNGYTYNVSIGGTGIVALNTNVTIDNLSVASGGRLTIHDSRSLTIAGGNGAGTITNNGTITLGSEGGNTYLSMDSAVLTGTGTLSLSDNTQNFVLTGSNHACLTNAAGHTIQGSGTIGSSGHATTLTNQGTIRANQVKTLIVESAVTNTGTMAAGGGTLRLSSAQVTNTGGTLQALDGSTLELLSSTVTGGTLATTGTGVIRNIGSATLTDITLNGHFDGSNTSTTSLAGTITNNGTITLGSGGGDTYLSMDSAVLTGTGTLSLSNNTQNFVLTGSNYAKLTNAAGHTIQGSGTIGSSSYATTLTNQGTIRANQTTPLVLDGTISNSGTLSADCGSTLRVAGTLANLSGGTLQALDGSTLELLSSTVTGGTLATTGTGVIRNIGSATLTDITLNGHFDGSNTSTTSLAGTITNNGTITLGSGGGDTYLSMDSAVLTGTGTLSLSNNTQNFVLTGSNYAKLTNAAGHTIQGSGTIGSSSYATTLTNQGTIRANQTTPLILDGTISNSGTLSADCGSTLRVAGTLANLSGGTLDGGAYYAAGAMYLPGAVTSNNASITLDGADSRILVNDGSANALENLTRNTGALNILNGKAYSGPGMVNDGTVRVSNATAAFSSAFANNGTFISDPATVSFHDDVSVSETGVMQGAAGDAYEFYRDFLINSTAPPWATKDVDLAFLGGTSHTFSFLSSDKGGMWDALTLGESDSLDVSGIGGALTIYGLISGLDISGTVITNITGADGTTIYYLASANGGLGGLTYSLSNGGILTPSAVPIPSTLLMLGSGLVGLLGVRRRYAATPEE